MQRALVAAEQVGGRIESGYWLADGPGLGQLPTSIKFHAASYGNGIYIAVGCAVRSSGSEANTSQYAYSADGAKWTTRSSLPISGNWATAIFANGNFIIGTSIAGQNYVSTDGKSWKSCNIPFSTYSYQIIAAGDKFFVYNGSGCAKSADGSTWEQFSPVGVLGTDYFSFNPDDKKMYCFRKNDGVYISEDGITFTKFFDNVSTSMGSVYNFCAGGKRAILSYQSGGGIYTRKLNFETGQQELAVNEDYFIGTVRYANGFFWTIDNWLYIATKNSYFAGVNIPYNSSLYDSDWGGTMVNYLNGFWIAWSYKTTSYSYNPMLWADSLNASMEDAKGTNKTSEVMSALMGNLDPTSIVQTNTLDAAYTQGVNSYKGE